MLETAQIQEQRKGFQVLRRLQGVQRAGNQSRIWNSVEGEKYPQVRLLARALAMELHHSIAKSMREELLQGVRLTEADLQLLRCEAAGHNSKVIGAAMSPEAKTIDSRFQRFNAKLEATDRRTAVRIARLYWLL